MTVLEGTIRGVACDAPDCTNKMYAGEYNVPTHEFKNWYRGLGWKERGDMLYCPRCAPRGGDLD